MGRYKTSFREKPTTAKEFISCRGKNENDCKKTTAKEFISCRGKNENDCKKGTTVKSALAKQTKLLVFTSKCANL